MAVRIHTNIRVFLNVSYNLTDTQELGVVQKNHIRLKLIQLLRQALIYSQFRCNLQRKKAHIRQSHHLYTILVDVFSRHGIPKVHLIKKGFGRGYYPDLMPLLTMHLREYVFLVCISVVIESCQATM